METAISNKILKISKIVGGLDFLSTRPYILHGSLSCTLRYQTLLYASCNADQVKLSKNQEILHLISVDIL